ncbi:MAG TPA: uroporphyrinogen-III synthase [Micropepsaceae bacterium]|jgi:uroporphyrinogen-III synthase|nr:uroporphyrinogen-III synthase [Micropepsaceae bacterium]
MRLLVTRPQDDAENLAGFLRKRGHDPVIAPVMEVQTLSGLPLALEGVQALLATSANGIRAASLRTERRDLTIYAVGPQTAEAARQAGFTVVISADGDAAALVETVAREADPAKGILLHAAGAETAGRLRQALQARGFRVETEVLYEALPVAKLPPAAQEALSDGMLDGVLLFSPRSAKTFAALVQTAGLASSCEGLTAFCISTATAEALAPLTFATMAIAGVPNQDAMLDLIPPTESPR